ncbi:MAG: glucose-6-phosphate isomerase, partial [Candidatus Riflebacteria bacterium]
MNIFDSKTDQEISNGGKLSETGEWLALKDHYQEIKTKHMRDMFANDVNRFEKFSLSFDDILLDYSKNIIESKTMDLLIDLAKASGIKEYAKKMFSGEILNWTEGRAVLHSALRNRSNKPVYVDGKDVMPDVKNVLEKMKTFCSRIRSGEWVGHTGKRIKNVVNIGIGGSDLGPVMVCEALKHYADGPTLRFVSNV